MPYIRAMVSDEAYEGWHAYCREHGVTVTALVEAMGPQLGEWAASGEISDAALEVVRRARDIDYQRGRRSRD